MTERSIIETRASRHHVERFTVGGNACCQLKRANILHYPIAACSHIDVHASRRTAHTTYPIRCAFTGQMYSIAHMYTCFVQQQPPNLCMCAASINTTTGANDVNQTARPTAPSAGRFSSKCCSSPFQVDSPVTTVKTVNTLFDRTYPRPVKFERFDQTNL